MKKTLLLIGFIIIFIFVPGYFFVQTWVIKIQEGNDNADIIVPIQPGQSRHDAANEIMTEWLDHFKKRQYIRAIEDYRINRIEIVDEDATTFRFTATFAIKPKGQHQHSEWTENTTGEIDGEWVTNITIQMLVASDKGRYRFHIFF